MAFTTGKVTLSATPQSIKATKTQEDTITLYAKSTNSGFALIGGKTEVETGECFELPAGASLTINLIDSPVVWLKGTASDVVSWIINGERA